MSFSGIKGLETIVLNIAFSLYVNFLVASVDFNSCIIFYIIYLFVNLYAIQFQTVM